MKQKTPPQMTTATSRSVLRQNSDKPLQTQPPPPQPPPRLRVSSKSPKSPPEVVNGVSLSSTRAKSVPPDLKNISKVKRGLAGSQKGREAEEAKVVAGLKRVLVLNQPKSNDTDGKKNKEKELLEKLEVSENLIKNLQSEVLDLKAELDKVKSLNLKLESQNKKLTEDLVAAEAKVAAVGSNEKNESIGEHQSPKFKDIQKLIAHKLERSKVKKETTIEAFLFKASIPTPAASHAMPETSSIGRKSPPNPCLPPPPPPPLPPSIPSRPSAKLAHTPKAPSVVQLFHSFKNQDGKKDFKGSVNHQKTSTY